MNNIWLVGLYKTKSKMEYMGIFSTEEKAVPHVKILDIGLVDLLLMKSCHMSQFQVMLIIQFQ
jgi:hypothetical protein